MKRKDRLRGLIIFHMCIFTCHDHLHDTLDLIEYPWSVFFDVWLFTPLETVANSLDTDQAQNFDKVSKCLKF